MNKNELSALKNSLIIVQPKTKKVVPVYEDKQTNAQCVKRYKHKKSLQRLEDIAVLDMETDPFDNKTKMKIEPFLAVLYADNFEPKIIWDNDPQIFVDRVIATIEALPRKYTIYAHNGGKFDFMFLLMKMRGEISFKGRGIMKASIGNHELRDSFHIIPEKLASYRKDDFNYDHLLRQHREKYREEIINYCLADCRYLLEIVKGFVKDFGMKLSIGQAALFELRKHYKYDCLTAPMDELIRKFFFGGRVECLAGKGKFTGDYKLYDVNSMYPFVMATEKHPIGNKYIRRPGKPNAYTCFLEIECENYGALVAKLPNEQGILETSTEHESGRFFTTIHEYNTALELGLISDVKILWCVDNNKFTSFDKFILPLYEKKSALSEKLHHMTKVLKYKGEEPDYLDVKKDYIFSKLLQNNAYGKFAQNPRKYKENYICAPGEKPPSDQNFPPFPLYQCSNYWLYQKPSEGSRFNNVGTAASITGAARAVLMRAIHGATDPIYCDTDSLICRAISGVELDDVKLGAWDLEAEFREVIVNGKKTYAGDYKEGGMPPKIRSKGVAGLTYQDMERIFEGEILEVTNKGVTLSKAGTQYYITRKVRSTARIKENGYLKPNRNSERKIA